MGAPSRNQRSGYYESVAEDWDSWMDRHELAKRLRLIFDRKLKETDVRGHRVLDAGCGTGHFSKKLIEWGAELISVDIGARLLSQARRHGARQTIEADICALPFPDGYFDLVLCTEVIEHTPSPEAAVSELCRVVAPLGLLLLTTPNRLWRPLITLAGALRLRSYAGYENWSGWNELPRWVESRGLVVEEQEGFNLLPSTFFCRPTFDALDRLTLLHPFMINMLLRARKRV